MYLRIWIRSYMQIYSQKIELIKEKIKNADAVMVGAGAGLSTAAGYIYTGERFKKYFADFEEKYGFHDMYSGGFYPYESPEELWAFWARYIHINRYMPIPKDTYSKLFSLIKDKDYFVLTTNVDHCFQRSAFDKSRIFYTQGDYGLFQCSVPCHQKTYDNEQTIEKMYSLEKDMRVPSELVPKCPVCGKNMTMNLRSDEKFVEDDGWNLAYGNYQKYIEDHKDINIVYLELGVGYNTPVIIKYPFWQMTANNPNATYVCINTEKMPVPEQISSQTITLECDIDKVLSDLLE